MCVVNPDKEVHFDEYCKKCEFYNNKEDEDPCWDCLDNPVNTYSKKPVYFKEKVKEKKK
jgi:hypothetical protein